MNFYSYFLYTRNRCTMKYFFGIFFFIISLFNLNAQGYEKNCYYGFTFEVSKNPCWGYGELVITEVESNSPAEAAGIKVGDIVMEINSKATYLRDNPTIASWLFDVYDPIVNFTIRNMNTYFKEYPLLRKCINTNAVSEKELSSIFSFYSIENTNSRKFVLPVKVEPNENVDYADYHTYDFYRDNTVLTNTDKKIMEILDKELQAKGLVRDTKDPDIIVQAYYTFEANPKFTGLNDDINSAQGIWRYDTDKRQMILLPAIDPQNSKKTVLGQFTSEFGFSFYDKKYINPGQLTQMWDCNIKDYLTSSYSFDEYIRIHTPLMLKQFPYTTSKTEGEYIVNFNKYNYTGIYFDADDPAKVRDVDPDSPAYKAGIRAGYTIKKIDNKKFEHTKEKLSEGYKKFISETMPYRDQSTRFTDATGYTDCMFWNPTYYTDIAKEFNKSAYCTNYSYLYNFEKYVNSKPTNSITIEAWDGMQLRIFNVNTEVRQSVNIKAL